MNKFEYSFGFTGPYLHIIVKKESDMMNYAKNLSDHTKLSVYYLDSTKCKTRLMFFKEIANSLKFPDYFGHNWDALEECLSDLDWIANNGWVLVFLNADKLLNEKTRDFKILIKLLDGVGREWSQLRCYDQLHKIEAKPFHFLFHVNPENEQNLRTRFEDINKIDVLKH